jgi:FKBP-type peptidyl-prolyl cis-trans isomerase
MRLAAASALVLIGALPCTVAGCRRGAADAERLIDTGLARVPLIAVRPLASGDGPRPRFGEMVHLNLVTRLPDGTTVRDTRADGELESFPMGRRATIQGLELVVSEMRVGDRMEARIPWQVAYGAAGAEGIPSRSDLICDVELVEIRSD